MWTSVEFTDEEFTDITETASERAQQIGLMIHDAVMDSLYR